jgi:glycosyltransferase involved in cell wall biosynthesis
LADWLAAKGHSPTIVHSASIDANRWTSLGLYGLAWLNASGRPRKLVPWHRFHPHVRVRFIPWLTPAFLPRADVTVLTAFQTAMAITRQTARTGPLAQIVYDYELWAGGDAESRKEIEAALSRSDVAHIATSGAVTRMLDDMGVAVVETVRPGVALDFTCRTLPSERQRTIGFSYRTGPHKGMAELLSSLEQVHDLYADVTIKCFGVGAVGLPPWVKTLGYLTNAELSAFYNECSIFVLPSRYEGWGLPAAEAMACGAAVVTTDCGGPADFAEHERTALVVRPGDTEALAHAIMRLLEDDNLRYRLASASVKQLSTMTWAQTATSLEAVLVRLVNAERIGT